MPNWKPVPGFGNYKVSDEGHVISSHSGKWKLLNPFWSPYGYRQVTLCRDGVRTTEYVHRLVLSAFVGEPKPGQVAHHKDGGRANNHISNLEWIEDGLHRAQHAAKLMEDDVRDIRRRYIPGQTCLIPGNARELADEYGISRMQVCNIARRGSWTHLE